MNSASTRACGSFRAVWRSGAAPSSAPAASSCRRAMSTSARNVGAGAMIDSHALVGSCAQIGERVHLRRDRLPSSANGFHVGFGATFTF